MDRKYNSTTNPKYLNNHKILNLKSTSQRIGMNNYSKPANIKNNIKFQYQKGIGEKLFENNSLNISNNNKIFNTNKNIINDDSSIDNISNIISYKHNKLPKTQNIFEKKQCSINNNINKSNNTFYNNNTTNICDSHTKSFQLKLKKMQEMNRTIIKENYIMKNNTFNPWKNSWFNIEKLSKSINNCKQKIINMKIKHQLLNKNFYSDDKRISNFNNRIINSVNGDNDKKIKQKETIPFLCCFSKS